MAVELMGFLKIDEQKAIQEAASEGLKGMEHLIRLLSHQPNSMDCTDLTDVTVSKFKKLISLLNRNGHARFRRAPIPFSAPSFTAPPPPPPPSSFASISQMHSFSLSTAQFTSPATLSPSPIVNQMPVQHAPSNFVPLSQAS